MQNADVTVKSEEDEAIVKAESDEDDGEEPVWHGSVQPRARKSKAKAKPARRKVAKKKITVKKEALKKVSGAKAPKRKPAAKKAAPKKKVAPPKIKKKVKKEKKALLKNKSTPQIVKIAGTSFRKANCQRALDKHGEVLSDNRETTSHRVELEPDPENPYDPNAIKVLLSGEFVGFIPKDSTHFVDTEADAMVCQFR
ncbi:hypothetical protein TL16_g03880 [Triparma laevis f. inornata]|uniref:HIRAN domain-containing protein n=1 Tax=Triparma laevis f. inornata TaxID=1714386 RepID=A0A9W7A603_9STRA|nr:hypothetical protein TL16_g03880 [Triparma laevis f. inornata]